MRPTEERSLHGYWAGDDRPDPLVAQNAPEFVAKLRALVQWSGLALEEIEQLARANGDILPPSIVSAALSHNTLPPEELVVALVAAVGDDDEMVELWASVLWRLEEEADATQYMAPHSAPPPLVPVSAVAAARQYSGGALAQAVQKRRNQNSWTGLHRGFQKGLRATGFGAKLGHWKAPLAVSATIFVLVVGVSWALASRSSHDNNAQPRSNPCCVAGSAGGSSGSPQPAGELTPSGMALVPPVPTSSTKPTQSPTPKLSPPRNSPTPTQTQEQLTPTLTGSATASCTNNGTDWVVTLNVTATLTNGSGNSPQGQAGKPGNPQPFSLSGTGTTFSGQASITVGPNTDPPPSGNIDWQVTVTVPGTGMVSDNGSKSYSCGG